MRIKLNFSNSKFVFNEFLNKEVNGFINKLLGEGNKYHGRFSRYSVSSIQGAVWNGDVYTFPNGGSVYISSDDAEFISLIIGGIMSASNLKIRDMKYINMEICDFEVGKSYDIVRTISPILISDGEKLLTFRDENFLETLIKKSRKKLISCGLNEKIANTLELELFHLEKANTLSIKIGDAVNIGSRVMLIAKGDRKARKLIYELGFGKCTGFGFGAVSLNEK